MTIKRKRLLAAMTTVAATGLVASSAIACGPKQKWSELVVVTDAGSVTDKAFNQQAMEAVENILGRKGSTSDYIKPKSHDSVAMANAYTQAAKAGKKYIFAPGFYHKAGIETFNKSQSTLSKKVTFITVDVNSDAPNVAPILFKIHQAAYKAGYFAAQYLIEIKKDTDPRIGMFAGGNFHGANDFLVGFVQGVKAYNDLKKPTNPVKFVGKSGANAKENEEWANKEMVDTGFDTGDSNKANQIITRFRKAKADIVLPAAGPMVELVANEADRFNDWSPKIIGVDTDMKQKYSNHSGMFLTSILKKVKEAMIAVYKTDIQEKGYKVPEDIHGKGQLSLGTTKNHFVGVANTGVKEKEEEINKLIKDLEKLSVPTDTDPNGLSDSWSSNPGNKPTTTNHAEIYKMFAKMVDTSI